MNNLLFGITLSALLSVTSLLIVLFRVSPLVAPAQAIPAFFLSLFLAVTTVSTLIFIMLWKNLPFHTWDTGALMSNAMRQGAFTGVGTVVALMFHILGLLNWWILLMIVGVFVLLEMALLQ